MEAEWLPFIERQGGEFWLHCRNCGTENLADGLEVLAFGDPNACGRVPEVMEPEPVKVVLRVYRHR
jgi:hypothetical protein